MDLAVLGLAIFNVTFAYRLWRERKRARPIAALQVKLAMIATIVAIRRHGEGGTFNVSELSKMLPCAEASVADGVMSEVQAAQLLVDECHRID